LHPVLKLNQVGRRSRSKVMICPQPASFSNWITKSAIIPAHPQRPCRLPKFVSG
jgi:hypothetical protein